MSAHLKGVDSNHMITIGQEGFYGPGSAAEVVNPGTGWATITGQNFSANHAPDTIDFAAIHLWPDNWEAHPPPLLPINLLPVLNGQHCQTNRKLAVLNPTPCQSVP